MKRAFLLLLLLTLLLLATLLQTVQEATVFHGGSLWGTIPLWQLRHALPCGLFAAGTLMVSIGVGAQFWRELLPLCGAQWTPEDFLFRLCSCGLWCGWLLLAICTTALPDIFPGAGKEGDGLFSREHYLLLQVGILPMAFCHALRGAWRARLALVTVMLSAGTALACGLLWWHDRPMDFLALSLLSPLALILLLTGCQTPVRRFGLGWLFVTSLALAAYALISRYLVLHYPPRSPSPPPHIDGDAVTLVVGATFALLALLPVCLPPLRRRQGFRWLSLPALLLVAACHLSALSLSSTDAAPSLPEKNTLMCYALALPLVALLATLRFLSLRPAQKSSQNEFRGCNQRGKGVD